ncbi:MAG: sigma-54 dependent transcriptional regulator [bacterium]
MDLRILIVEDDALLRKSLYDRLTRGGMSVQACDTLGEARRHIADDSFDVMLIDMCLPDGDGVKFFTEIAPQTPCMDAVVMTAFADVKSAVHALKSGAYDYLTKPFEDVLLDKVLRNISDKRMLNQQVSALAKMTGGVSDASSPFGDLVGTAGMEPVYEKAKKIARSSNTTVMILGESGTGKGVLAKAIHRASPRRDRPFVDVNCSAIPGQLMESELFGYEKGAFTDAKVRKQGLLELAHGGTFFMDEIGDMDANLQGKLLKVLEEKEFRRLGSSRSMQVDVRVIVATHRDLKKMVKSGTFREDLYYRLSVIPVVIPPLRERKDGIGILARSYLDYYCKQVGRAAMVFAPEAMKALTQYTWPGNVRELRNLVERCVILASGDKIGVDDLSLSQPSDADEPDAGETTRITSLAESEKRLISAVLNSVHGNKNKAADILKIHRTTLYKKMEEYGLDKA